MTSPTGTQIANGRVLLTLPVTLLIGINTGDVWPAHWPEGTGATANQYNLNEIASPDRSNRPADPASTAEDIDYVRGVLKLTVTELARYLGVTRQAVYDWRSGAHIKSHNISKLENLRGAAETIDTTGLTLSALQLNRKLPGGRNLLETVALGGDGAAAARSLVTMIQREAQQREERSARAVGRRPVRDSSLGRGMATL